MSSSVADVPRACRPAAIASTAEASRASSSSRTVERSRASARARVRVRSRPARGPGRALGREGHSAVMEERGHAAGGWAADRDELLAVLVRGLDLEAGADRGDVGGAHGASPRGGGRCLPVLGWWWSVGRGGRGCSSPRRKRSPAGPGLPVPHPKNPPPSAPALRHSPTPSRPPLFGGCLSCGPRTGRALAVPAPAVRRVREGCHRALMIGSTEGCRRWRLTL